ncbi:MAG: SUMF1/EgtB/PvdO family nonheme iron enzyme [Bryobacteraceae bacterium]|nr:SUMF1/EgtB/PvdO family nonheme iron enzyme [Bryobacteraceae bacterium]
MQATLTEPQLRAPLKLQLSHARGRTDELFRLVRPDALYERPAPERHRLIFYLGHVEAFDWNLIGRHALDRPSFHADFDRLFAFGIDPDASGLPQDRSDEWPSVEEVSRYNRRARERIDALIEEAPAEMAHVAIEHRLMHAETLSYLLHDLPASAKTRPAVSVAPSGPPPETRYCEIPPGIATLGQPRESGFGWDNEFDETKIKTPGFSVGRYKVTNGEYLRFVGDGGPTPHFWKPEGGEWKLRTMFGVIPLPLNWPAYVTHVQASAYAAWAGKSLPTEAQYHRAAYGTPDGPERAFPWGAEAPDPSRGNFDFHAWDPLPVDAHPAGDSAFGASQMLGNGWEWTRDSFRPLPGFRPFDFYPGYSAPFFDEDHFVLKGASARTASKLLRRSFRNWFRKEYRHAYAGFRCVE